MKQYNTLMEDENLIDFSSIQTEAYKLLIEEPSILEEIQQKIKYVMPELRESGQTEKAHGKSYDLGKSKCGDM